MEPRKAIREPKERTEGKTPMNDAIDTGLPVEAFAALRGALQHALAKTNSDEMRRQFLHGVGDVSLREHVPLGQTVVIDLRTFEFVCAGTRTVALRAFVGRFGAGAGGWVLERHPISIGRLG